MMILPSTSSIPRLGFLSKNIVSTNQPPLGLGVRYDGKTIDLSLNSRYLCNFTYQEIQLVFIWSRLPNNDWRMAFHAVCIIEGRRWTGGGGECTILMFEVI